MAGQQFEQEDVLLLSSSTVPMVTDSESYLDNMIQANPQVYQPDIQFRVGLQPLCHCHNMVKVWLKMLSFVVLAKKNFGAKSIINKHDF